MKEKIIKWFSGLDTETCQKTSKDVSKLLESFDGIKQRIGNRCMYTPCNGHQYSRGVCHKHYYFLAKLSYHKSVGWNSLIDLGLCYRSMKNHDGNGKINVRKDVKLDDPLLALIRYKEEGWKDKSS